MDLIGNKAGNLPELFLNSDLALLLLALLDPHDLIRIRCVCQRWKNLVTRVPARCRRSLQSLCNIPKMAELLPQTERLKCFSINIPFPPFPNLRSLSISSLRARENVPEFPYRHLTRLAVSDTKINYQIGFPLHLITTLTELRCLKVATLVYPTDLSFISLFCNLETLRLYNFSYQLIDSDCVLTTLRNLRLVEVPLAANWLYSKCLTNLTQLISPEEYSVVSETYQSLLNQLPLLLPKLRALVLNQPPSVSLAALTHISSLGIFGQYVDLTPRLVCLTQLRRLRLAHVRAPEPTSEPRGEFIECPLLRRLEVIEYDEEDDEKCVEALRQLVKCATNLVSLVWHNSYTCDLDSHAEEIAAALRPLSHLQRLMLGNFFTKEIEATRPKGKEEDGESDEPDGAKRCCRSLFAGLKSLTSISIKIDEGLKSIDQFK